MRSDRYTKVVLTLLTLGVWALMLTEVELPDLTAQAEATAVPSSAPLEQVSKKPGGEAGAARAPAATLPLRWRIPTVFEHIGVDTSCSTVISVRNLTPATVNVEVEWFRWDLVITALRPGSIPANEMLLWATDDSIELRPYYPDDDANLGPSFIGFADVHAADPRILVTATVMCRDGTAAGAKILSHNEMPAFPVGAALEFFQAGMPATWTPPMAVPEVPE